MPRFLIGIDLGTTNSALAYVDTASPARSGIPQVKPFRVPQHVSQGEVEPLPLLPSFQYLPGAHDLPAGTCALPWDPQAGFLVGEFARRQGALVPGRLVASAKSWLCHAGVDRTAAILPWGAAPEVAKVSPVEASKRTLLHLRSAWNHVMAGRSPDARLEAQPIVLTVPASFDDVARQLTAEAARQAGFEQLILLEEPQAAFYAWIAHEARTSHHLEGLSPGMRCLVIDVGGGTSDFSLIETVADEGQLGFVRQAVGEHLLLGGDNMDLALARAVEGRLPQAGKLDAARFAALTQSCRQAKEALLGPNPPADVPITVMGRGRSVIGGALSTHLTATDVNEVLLEGFFPLVGFEAFPQRKSGLGLQELGLPFVSDPAVTVHLAAFLRQHGITPERPPEAILFNGGVFQSAQLRQRLVAVMRRWFDQPGQPWQPITLTSPSLDLAVALGAAYYGWLRHTGGKRISGGLARSYYLGVRSRNQEQGLAQLCVVSQGLEEGTEVRLAEPVLELALGQPVQFPLWTSTLRAADRPGSVLDLPPGELFRLNPVQSVLRGGKRSGTKTVPVTLAARLTEIGTLELSLVAQNSDQRWRLEFNTRALVDPENETDSRPGLAEEVWPEGRVQVAAGRIADAFNQPEPDPLKQLTRRLEDALEAGRWRWPTGLCRRLFDLLLAQAEQRHRTPVHLARWLQLTGFTLRPGFGEAKDRFRVEQLWKVLASPTRVAVGPGTLTAPRTEAAGTADVWILWRRVAGGLSTAHQQSLWERLRPFLIPGKGGRSSFRPNPNDLAEMWRAAGSLERLDVGAKTILGQAALRELRRPPFAAHLFWALARLGARRLLYGPLNAVLPAETVEPWLRQLAPLAPDREHEKTAWQLALAHLARRVEHRSLDVTDETRTLVVGRLEATQASSHMIRLVLEGGELDGAEARQFFGEELPVGLRLAEAS
ncbi:MAG TPA: Hsp70 family protein [Gemmatales bacterium]|nr:Hsp70 family protein [Gemmatales bacterium]HMP60289.1 Hsp70 family protein [Gemmatales bacterium]